MNRFRIVLQHTANSSLAGTAQLFSGEVVRIGRKTDNDVVFDPRVDLLVSGHHAELRANDGELSIVDLGSKNGTFVNGVRLTGPRVLAPGDRIELGPDGPVLEAEIELVPATAAVSTPDDMPPPVAVPAKAPPDPSPDPSEDKPASRTPFEWDEDLTPPPGELHAGSPGGAVRPPRGAPDRTKTDPPPGVIPDDPDDAHELHDPHEISPAIKAKLAAASAAAATSARQRNRRMLILAVILLLSASLAALQWQRKFGNHHRAKDESEGAVARRSSIYSIVIRGAKTANGASERIAGSAFVLGPDRLATSATIASMLTALPAGEVAIAKMPGDGDARNARELRIVRSEIHPNFADFSRIAANLTPFDAETERFAYTPAQLQSARLEALSIAPGRSQPAACDVALLFVETDDNASDLGPPLELASEKDLSELAIDAALSTSPPIAIDAESKPSITGRLERTTNFLGQRPRSFKDATEILLGLDLAALGPAGIGLPLLDSHGHVIAITTSRLLQFPADPNSKPRAAATRANVLAELLRGDGANAAAERRTSWETLATDAFKAGTAQAESIAQLVTRGMWRARSGDENTTFTIAQQWSYAALPSTSNPSDRATALRTITAAGGFLAIVAIGVDGPQAVRLDIKNAGRPYPSAGGEPELVPRYVSAAIFDDAPAGTELQITAHADAPAAGRPDGQVAIFVLRRSESQGSK